LLVEETGENHRPASNQVETEWSNFIEDHQGTNRPFMERFSANSRLLIYVSEWSNMLTQ